MTTQQMIWAATRAYRAGDFKESRRLLDEAAAQDDAADYRKRIRNGKDLLIMLGAYDHSPWVPQVDHWRECPALGACPKADSDCAKRCELEAAGWPTEE